MYHIVPLGIGILVGAAAVTLLRSKKVSHNIKALGTTVRQGTVDGLSGVEKAVGSLKDKIQNQPVLDIHHSEIKAEEDISPQEENTAAKCIAQEGEQP